jgi:hypothetical protein
VAFLALFLFAANTVYGQMSANSGNVALCTLQVNVAYVTGGGTAAGMRVQITQGLTGASASDVAVTNSSGTVEFPNLHPGD